MPNTWWDKSAVLIALCALGVSISAIYVQRDAAKRSNKPYLFVNYYYNEAGSGFRISNHGVGAAYLHWFQILVDGQPQPSWEEMTKLLGFEKDVYYQFGKPGAVYPPANFANIFWVQPGPADQHLQKNFNRVAFKICYCSIFEDCWLNTNIHAPQEVKSCDPPPKIRYGGLPDPASPW